MRLGQIARKVGVQPKNIVEALNKQFQLELEAKPNLNFKLSEEHVAFIETNFVKTEEPQELTENQPDQPESSVNVELTENTEPKPAITDSEIEKGTNVEANQEETNASENESEINEINSPANESVEPDSSIKNSGEPVKEDSSDSETEKSKVINWVPGEKITTSADPESEFYELDENVEVIRAPKVNLQGVKVLGKIELPEPKPKATELPEDSEEHAKNEEELKDSSSSQESDTVSPTEATTSEEGTTENTKVSLDQMLEEDIVIQTTEAPKEELDPATRRKLEYEERKRQRAEREERRKKRKEKEKKRKEREARKAEERRKKEAEEKEKERRRQAYLEKLNKSPKQAEKVAQTKKKKRKNADGSDWVDPRPVPKTLLGKFWRWLNT